MMKYRRCANLLLEPQETVAFNLADVLAGGAGLDVAGYWHALAPHLEAPVCLDAAEVTALGRVSPTVWRSGPLDEVQQRLFDCGLMVGDDDDAQAGASDPQWRSGHWWTPAAAMHRLGRWSGVDSASDMEANRLYTASDLREQLGPPPAAVVDRGDPASSLALPRAPAEAVLAEATRTTCRNFEPERAVSADMLSRLLAATVMAHGEVRTADDMQFLKKAVPSGGGLHATEAYLLVQRVEGVAAGLYHYRPLDHALAPLPSPGTPLDALARQLLAGQHWFSTAPVLMVLAPRYPRAFWKYRNHAKAYRALLLDIGHLSQAFYTEATAAGLGAFVTSAINEVDIENAFGLDALSEGPLAICGAGWRGDRMEHPELDPRARVWPAPG